MIPIPFFMNTITIVPHTATFADDLNRRFTVEDFAQGAAVSLFETDSGELYLRDQGGRFIEGPEVD